MKGKAQKGILLPLVVFVSSLLFLSDCGIVNKIKERFRKKPGTTPPVVATARQQVNPAVQEAELQQRRKELLGKISKSPKDPKLHYELGQFYASTGDIALALVEYRKVIQYGRNTPYGENAKKWIELEGQKARVAWNMKMGKKFSESSQIDTFTSVTLPAETSSSPGTVYTGTSPVQGQSSPSGVPLFTNTGTGGTPAGGTTTTSGGTTSQTTTEDLTSKVEVRRKDGKLQTSDLGNFYRVTAEIRNNSGKFLKDVVVEVTVKQGSSVLATENVYLRNFESGESQALNEVFTDSDVKDVKRISGEDVKVTSVTPFESK